MTFSNSLIHALFWAFVKYNYGHITVERDDKVIENNWSLKYSSF